MFTWFCNSDHVSVHMEFLDPHSSKRFNCEEARCYR